MTRTMTPPAVKPAECRRVLELAANAKSTEAAIRLAMDELGLKRGVVRKILGRQSPYTESYITGKPVITVLDGDFWENVQIRLSDIVAGRVSPVSAGEIDRLCAARTRLEESDIAAGRYIPKDDVVARGDALMKAIASALSPRVIAAAYPGRIDEELAAELLRRTQRAASRAWSGTPDD